MLQNIRDNSKGIVSKILVGLIAFTFMIWGAESLFSFNSDASAPAEVNGEEITLQELMQTAELQRRQILASNPDIDPVTLDQQAIQASALQQLIAQKVMLQYIQSNDLALSDAAIDQMIVQSSDFQVNGVFNRELFESLLRNFGLTPLTYRQQLKRGNLIDQVQQAISTTAFAMESDADLIARLDGQTRDLSVIKFSLSDQLQSVNVEQAEIDQYYSENQALFMAPESVSIDFVTLNLSDFYDQIEVSSEELQKAYTDAKDLSMQMAEGEAEASHILFLVNDSQTEEQALELAKVAYSDLEQGQSFEDVAGLRSQDESTADNGGYIGLLARGEFGDKFDDALFDLNPGQYSEPVVTEFGVQILYSHAKDASDFPSFEEQKQALTLSLKQSGAESLFVAASEEMADIAFSSSDLFEVSEVLDLEIETSALFGRDGGEGIASYDRVVAAAFGDDVLLEGNNSNVLELTSDKLVVIRLNEYNEAAQLPIALVQEQISNQLLTVKAAKNLDDKANDYVESLKNGNTLAAIASTEGLGIESFESVDRASTQVDSFIVQNAFRLPRTSSGQSFGVAQNYNGDVAIVQVNSVNDADLSDQTPEQKDALINALARLQGQADMASLEKSLNDKAVIETF